MTKILENFIKKVKKLENYFILRKEDEYFVIGTKITIKEHIELHSTFSTYTTNKDKEIHVFFILAINENNEDFKNFRKHDFPILVLPKIIISSKIDMIRKYLDDFVKMKF